MDLYRRHEPAIKFVSFVDFPFRGYGFIYLLSRVIYSCALNDQGGVECDFTVTILDVKNEYSTSPGFQVI